MNNFYYLIFPLVLILLRAEAKSQIGFGVIYGVDAYQYHANPTQVGATYKRGLGSALFNLNIGPKLWIGGKDFSVSAEGQIGLAPFALDVDEFKGLGAVYFPFMVALNFRGLSGFHEKGKWGFSLAAGIQNTQTDLYFLKDEFETLSRSIYSSSFGQINVGVGASHTATYIYFRYGSGDDGAKDFHVGLMIDYNLIGRKKAGKKLILSRPE